MESWQVADKPAVRVGVTRGYRFSSQDSNLFPQIDRFFAQPDPAIIALLIGLGIFFILALIVIFVLLGTIGRVGLIRGAMKAEQGAQRLTFGELWRDGLKYFWRVFGLNLLVGVVIFIAVLALFVPGVILTGLTFGLIPFMLYTAYVPDRPCDVGCDGCD